MKPRVFFKLRGLQVRPHMLKKQSNLLIALFAYVCDYEKETLEQPYLLSFSVNAHA